MSDKSSNKDACILMRKAEAETLLINSEHKRESLFWFITSQTSVYSELNPGRTASSILEYSGSR